MNKPMKFLLALLAAAGIVISIAAFGLMWTCIGLLVIVLWELAKFTGRRLRAESEHMKHIYADELGPDTNGDDQ